tara:strand:+ start:52 stop:1110 length:1059 start_codon:yes stop_codon:yes gene_type:complete
MITNKILSLTASIIKIFIILNLFSISNSVENNSKYLSSEKGTLSLMYHRFNEHKYPSTNIQMNIFKEHIKIIKSMGYEFENPISFDKNFLKGKNEKKILLTIDDAFLSFYENAWPYLKENKIPFILFVSTEPIGKNGYMNWEQLKEIEKHDFAFLGNHSHTHEYLIDFSFSDFKKDIDTSINIFEKNIGYNPIFFSYPFGEYSQKQVNFIKKKFKYAFGQHSGVIDINKSPYELPRFPINEKYGDLERFSFLINLLPFQFKKIYPEDKYITKNNPPNLIIEFFPEQKNLNQINCFSDEGNKWEKSNIEIVNQKLIVNFREKFSFRRGRINCSLNDIEGWRWFGLQFSVKVSN